MLPGIEVVRYFKRFGAETAAEWVDSVLEIDGLAFEQAQVDFDLERGISPRVGFNLQPSVAGRLGWEHLIGRIVRLGAASPVKPEALMRWPGESTTQPGTGWKFRRDLSHLKLLSSSQGRIEAKAYFGITPIPL